VADRLAKTNAFFAFSKPQPGSNVQQKLLNQKHPKDLPPRPQDGNDQDLAAGVTRRACGFPNGSWKSPAAAQGTDHGPDLGPEDGQGLSPPPQPR